MSIYHLISYLTAFIVWKKNNCFQKTVLTLLFCYFVDLLPILVNKRSRKTIMLSREGAIVQNLMFLKNSLWNYWLQHEFFFSKKEQTSI